MNPIDTMFHRLAAAKKKAFIPFVPAGDPDIAATGLLVKECARRGASLIEIGFPYSDPIADGSVIQASYTRALSKGLKIDDVFQLVSELKSGEWSVASGQQGNPLATDHSPLATVPLVGMVSYSLVHHRGAERFVTQAKQAGFSGAIVPDLPVEESDTLSGAAAKHDFKLIQLVTPTTPRDRAIQIAKKSTGFLYCVSVVGITGERAQMPPDLLQQLAWLRTQTSLPLCVGFGISTPEHVRMLRDHADGLIVGSALVRLLEQAKTKPIATVVQEVGDRVAELVEAADSPKA